MRIRPGGVRDVATFTRLINEQYQWLRGEDLWQEDELAATLISASGDPVDNDRYVEIDGEPVAAVHVHMSEPYTKGTLTIAAPPHEQRAEIVRQLLHAGERIVSSQPAMKRGAPVDVLMPRDDSELISVAQDCGYEILKKVTTLEADVFDAPASALPPDVTMTTFSVTRDLDDGYEVIRQTFPPELGAWHMSRRDYEYCLRNDPTALPGLSVLAQDADGPVALALNFLDTMQPLSGLIAALGVLPRRRRQGIGKAVTLESYDRFRSRGWQHARMATVLGIALDDNDYPFYRSVGMSPVFDDLVLAKDSSWR
jgi:ribosomal protein S18 acetylase RimI-like enzyme